MLTFIALSAVLMQQPPAPPAPPQAHTRVMFMGADGPGGLDKDGDGQISREEFAAPMNDHFARMDTNGDGRLSTEELTAGHGAMGEDGEHEVRIMRGPGGPGVRHFEMRREHAGGADGAHAGHGAGGAGEGRTMVFTRGEPGAGAEREVVIIGGPEGQAPTWRGAHAQGGPEHEIEIRRMGGPGGENDLDADNDGRISEAEFTAPLREAFARMDADRSGFIEAGERSSGRREVFVHRIEVGADGED